MLPVLCSGALDAGHFAALTLTEYVSEIGNHEFFCGKSDTPGLNFMQTL
jgi:hypothetical protein